MSGCSLSLSLPSLLTKKPRRKVIITWKNKKLPKKQPKKCTMNTDKLVLDFFFVSCKRNSFLWKRKVFSPEVLVMDTRLTETWNITENNTRRMNDLFLLKGIRNNEWESCSWFKNNKNRLHSLVSGNCPVDGGLSRRSRWSIAICHWCLEYNLSLFATVVRNLELNPRWVTFPLITT